MSEAVRTADKFFTKEQGQQIVEAIKAAERQSSAELRVHLEDHCGGAAWQRAREVFYELEMDDTDQQNGLLIYLAVIDRQFAIYADEGYDPYVSPGSWDELVAHLEGRFKTGEHLLGIVEALGEIGNTVKAWFPSQREDRNELPDELSIG